MYLSMMIEGSRAGSRSGSVPLTSGSGRTKNMWFRIRNTAIHTRYIENGNLPYRYFSSILSSPHRYASNGRTTMLRRQAPPSV